VAYVQVSARFVSTGQTDFTVHPAVIGRNCLATVGVWRSFSGAFTGPPRGGGQGLRFSAPPWRCGPGFTDKSH
jgi:hypothetical protein